MIAVEIIEPLLPGNYHTKCVISPDGKHAGSLHVPTDCHGIDFVIKLVRLQSSRLCALLPGSYSASALTQSTPALRRSRRARCQNQIEPLRIRRRTLARQHHQPRQPAQPFPRRSYGLWARAGRKRHRVLPLARIATASASAMKSDGSAARSIFSFARPTIFPVLASARMPDHAQREGCRRRPARAAQTGRLRTKAVTVMTGGQLRELFRRAKHNLARALASAPRAARGHRFAERRNAPPPTNRCCCISPTSRARSIPRTSALCLVGGSSRYNFEISELTRAMQVFLKITAPSVMKCGSQRFRLIAAP